MEDRYIQRKEKAIIIHLCKLVFFICELFNRIKSNHQEVFDLLDQLHTFAVAIILLYKDMNNHRYNTSSLYFPWSALWCINLERFNNDFYYIISTAQSLWIHPVKIFASVRWQRISQGSSRGKQWPKCLATPRGVDPIARHEF